MWRAFQSQHLNGIEYDDNTISEQYVTVQFNNGAVYRTARPLPRTELDNWLQSGSPGSYFHSKIKDTYGMMKIVDGTTKTGRRSGRRY